MVSVLEQRGLLSKPQAVERHCDEKQESHRKEREGTDLRHREKVRAERVYEHVGGWGEGEGGIQAGSPVLAALEERRQRGISILLRGTLVRAAGESCYSHQRNGEGKLLPEVGPASGRQQ